MALHQITIGLVDGSTFDGSLIFLFFLVAIAATVASFGIMYSRIRRQARKEAKVLPKVPDGQPQEAKHEGNWKAEERQRLETEGHQLGEESHQVDEEQLQAAEKRECVEMNSSSGLEATEQEVEADSRQKAEELPQTKEELKSFEEENRSRADETQLKVEGEESLKPDAERGPLGPLQRGGRHRGPIGRHGKQSTQETKRRVPKPEIVCWKRERQWIVGIEVPEELLASPCLEILQNATLLRQDELDEGCWCLEQASGEVTVRWNEDAEIQETQVLLGEHNYLLFRLGGQNQNYGRRVNFPSSGWYLVVVPENWVPDRDLSDDPPPVAPEPVCLVGYRAHFLYLEGNVAWRISFRTQGGRQIVIESKKPKYELVGNRLNDSTEGMGSFFGREPPEICSTHELAWNDVGTIVVGEEGFGQKRWRMAFRPVQGVREQKLPPEVAARESGWFFVRVYDTKDDLLESLNFRFCAALKSINVSPHPCLPDESGHSSAWVEFLHAAGCQVRLSRGREEILDVERNDQKTTAKIPVDPAWDLTCWSICPVKGQEVEASVLLERVWWGLGKTASVPHCQMIDKPLIVSREDFEANSEAAIWVWLPKPRWLDGLHAGFELSRQRWFRAVTTKREISIPLREFMDSAELGGHREEAFLKIWIVQGKGESEAKVARVPAEAAIPSPPSVEELSSAQACCSTCDHARTKSRMYWCGRHKWSPPHPIVESTFDKQYSAFKCREWRGEFLDPSGKWVEEVELSNYECLKDDQRKSSGPASSEGDEIVPVL